MSDDKFVEKTVEKAIKEVSPSETDKNRILVGRFGSGVDYSYSFYNPHNARFYFRFDKWNFVPDMTLFRVINSSELCLESFGDCRIVVKKSLIEVTNKIDSVRRFTVYLSSRSEAIKEAVAILEREVVRVLRDFVSRFGGSSDFVCVKRHVPDNKILHDRIIDSLDRDLRWNDDVSKKVYAPDVPLNVEYKKPVYAETYFRNAGLREFAPEIVSELDGFNKKLDLVASNLVSLSDANRVMADNMSSHIPLVQKATVKLEDDSLAVNSLRSSVSKLTDVVSRIDSRMVGGVSPLKPTSTVVFPLSHQSDIVVRESVLLTPNGSLPSTISKQDVLDRSKAYRLFRAGVLLREWGWNGNNWGGGV